MMGGGPLSFNRPSVSFKSEDEHAVHSIPELIEFNAKFNADYIFCIQAEKALLEDSPSLLHVTYAQLKRAICCCSQWFKSSVQELVLPEIIEDGAGSRKGPPVALLLDSDINLLVHTYTLMSLGIPTLLLSARLSPAAAQHLLRETSARALIHSARLAYKAKEIPLASHEQDDGEIRVYAAKDHGFWFDSTNGDVATDQSICEPGYDGGDRDRSVLILHSSGTTGLPKPIYTSHKYLLSFVTCHAFESEESAQRLNLSTLPLYHGYGLVTPALSLGIGKTFCIPISSVNPIAASVLQLLDCVRARCLMTVPSILEEFVHNPDATGVQKLAKLDFVAFGGGNLKPAVGNGLTEAGVNLLNHFGTTESGPLAPIFIPGPGYEWQYFRLRRDIELRIEPTSTPNDGNQHFKLITYPFGWDKPFEIQDQFVTSPRNSMADFNAVGRKDSVIVLATGEKVQPTIIETILSEHPLVTAAIAFGDGYFQVGVIVQPSQATSSDDFKAAIWPTILEANELMDAHARIASKDAIIVVPRTFILPTSDKGSLLRRELYAMLECEIEQVYQQLESEVNLQTGQFMLDRHGDIKQQLKDLIQHALPKWNVPAEDWTISNDLFELGMDSLQAVELRRLLMPSIQSAEVIPRDLVYRHPSVSELAEAIQGAHRKQKLAQSVDVRQKMVNDFVEQYSLRTHQSDPAHRQGTPQKQGENYVVLLTGSTGSLGCHLVAHLATFSSVKEIICLIRPATSRDRDPRNRQNEALRDKLLSLPPELCPKITTIQATLSLPQLGLTLEDYNSLLQRVTHILHNAWPMNFNWRLSSFQSQFQAVHNLLRLALDVRLRDEDTHVITMRNRIRFVFVSSIAVVGECSDVDPIPETNISNTTYTNRIGYAEAKLVCERIVERARDDFAQNLEAASVRIGQMSGSKESGFWNSDEHIAALLKSSVAINSLPALEGTLSWLPVDVAASSLSDILLSNTQRPSMSNGNSDALELQPLFAIYHLENPVRWPWDNVIHVLASLLPQQSDGQAQTMPLVPYSTWLDHVVSLGDTSAESYNGDNLKQHNTTPTDGIVLEKDKTILADASLSSQLVTTMHAGKNTPKSSNPAYNLADFFATDFRRMACGSVVLDTHLAFEASSSLRDFSSLAGDVAVRDKILDRYIGYWRRCSYL